MGQKIKLRKILKDNLYHKYEKGHGQAKENKVHNGTSAIHSHNTYKTYMKWVEKFCLWCKENDIKELEKAQKAVPEYLKEMEQKQYSVWTIKTALSAIAKAMNCKTTDFDYHAPKRERANIERSRNIAVRDKHFSAKNNEALIHFCESTGLRRREITALKGADLRLKNGKAYLYIDNGKGGKIRLVEVILYKQEVVDMCERADKGLIFPKVHSCADIHGYRGTYAKALYQQYARPLKEIPNNEKYFCRGDMKGTVLDKIALGIVSQNLGHNRLDVVVNNYMYGIV